MKYNLEEIIDIETLKNLLENFTRITGAVTAILDMDGQVLVATGWQDICTQFHRINPDSSRRCLESDTYLASQLEAGEKYNVYQCKNGLVDVAAPIIVDGNHVGNVFTGQFLFSKPDQEFFKTQAKEFEFDEDSYLSSLTRVPVFTKDQVEKTMSFLVGIAETIGEMGSVRLRNQSEILLRKKAEESLRKEITEKIQSQAELEQARKSLELQVKCINRLQSRFIEDCNSDELFDCLLVDVLKLTNSVYGFIAEVRQHDNKSPYLQALAISNIAWNEETRTFYDAHAPSGFRFSKIHGLFGAPYTSGLPVISNDPANDPRSCGLPDGHPPLDSFLGLPLNRGSEVVGVIGLANRPNGYDQAVVEFLSPVILASAQIVSSHRNQRNKLEAESALNTSEIRNRLIVKAAQVAVWDWDLETDVTIWNDELTTLFGHAAGPVENSKQWWLNFIHPEDYARVADSMSTYLSSDQETWQVEYRFKRADEQWATVIDWGVAIKDEAGNPVNMVGAMMDITIHRQEEETRDRLLNIIESAKDFIGIADVNGNTLYVNQSGRKLMGFGPEENLSTMKIHEYHPPETQQLLQKIGLPTAIRDGAWEGETEFLSRDGQRIPTSQILISHKSSIGNINFLSTIARDISERKAIEETLKQERQSLLNILEAMDDGVYIVNRDYEIEFINHVIKREFGPVNEQKCYIYFHNRSEPCAWCKNPEVFVGKSVHWEWTSSKNGRTYDLFDTPLRNCQVPDDCELVF